MDIMNELPSEQFIQIDDLLSFISIYDDTRRTCAYLRMLFNHREQIAGKVCVDAGCGMGIFSEFLVKLGARKVYAVEKNSGLLKIARSRLQRYPQVELVAKDIRNFHPPMKVDVIVHELFGQLLYDEDLLILQNLSFCPQTFLPNRALLKGGLVSQKEFVDRTVTLEVLSELKGVLVSGLFDDANLPLQFEVVSWEPNRFMEETTVDISNREGDLLYLGIEIYDGEQRICLAGECSNWSYVWTPREGDVFRLRFVPAERGSNVFFQWIY